jgi:hypothetical protein
MSTDLGLNACPRCNNTLLINAKGYPVGLRFTCRHCLKKLVVIGHIRNGVLLNRDIDFHDDETQTLIDYAEKFMPLKKYGFDKSTQFLTKDREPTVIYDSEFCRVKFFMELEYSQYGPYYSYKSLILYGRLHALNDNHLMKWNNEICTCWHSDMPLIVSFLNGDSPQLAAENRRETFQALDDYLHKDIPTTNQIEYPFRLHSKIWNAFGKKLFNLFDLRQTELWKEFTQFNNEYWNILDDKSNTSFSQKKIC